MTLTTASRLSIATTNAPHCYPAFTGWRRFVASLRQRAGPGTQRSAAARNRPIAFINNPTASFVDAFILLPNSTIFIGERRDKERSVARVDEA